MSRNLSLDLLKLVLSAFVVSVHAGFFSDIWSGLAYVLNNGVFRISVPCFLLISGYFFESSLRGGLRPWLMRVLWLYAVWMAIYAPFWLPQNLGAPAEVARILVFGYWHLWYLSAMALGGAMLYGLRGLGNQTLFLVTFGIYLLGVVLQYGGAAGLFDGIGLGALARNINATRNGLFQGLPYLALGLLLRRTGMAERIGLRVALPAALAALALTAIEAKLNVTLFHHFSGFDLLAAAYIAAPLVFISALRISIEGKTRILGDLAGGIYFVHIMVMFLLMQIVPVSATPLALLVFAVSAPIGYGLVRLKRYLPLM